jgi:ATPases involved in chromosome partitioning
MSENCSHNCDSCSCQDGCEEKKNSFRVEANSSSSIRKVIGVVSGKGGVGKSFVTSALAVMMRRAGYKTAVLDADITGPSIPKAFGIKGTVESDGKGIFPVLSKTGIPVMSLNLLLPDETQPVVWRGPIIAGTVKQFWSEVYWGDVDYMFVDMPPGTGDVPLTVFQSLPVDGIIVVTSPQDLVSMIVEKAVNMAKEMDIPVLGIVQNYSYFLCPDCGKKHYIFGESKVNEVAQKCGIGLVAEVPLDSKVASLSDKGLIENYDEHYLDGIVDYLKGMTK